MRIKIYIVITCLLSTIAGIFIGYQLNKPRKLDSWRVKYDLENGKCLEIHNPYIGNKIGRMILSDINSECINIDIWFNYDGSVDEFVRSTPDYCFTSKYDMKGFLTKQIVIDRKNKEYKVINLKNENNSAVVKPDGLTAVLEFNPVQDVKQKHIALILKIYNNTVANITMRNPLETVRFGGMSIPAGLQLLPNIRHCTDTSLDAPPIPRPVELLFCKITQAGLVKDMNAKEVEEKSYWSIAPKSYMVLGLVFSKFRTIQSSGPNGNPKTAKALKPGEYKLSVGGYLNLKRDADGEFGLIEIAYRNFDIKVKE